MPDVKQEEINSSYVDYYFNIFVDSEIAESTICDSINMLKSNKLHMESEFQCPDRVGRFKPEIYLSDIRGEDLDTCPD